MIPGDVPHAMQVLAALEEWCAHEGDERRRVAFEFVETWRAYLTLGTRTSEHQGVTLADALAQAAQIVVSDPTLAAVCTCTLTKHERLENRACPVHFPKAGAR